MIDYKLVKEIGATHYSKLSGSYYKLTDCELLFFNGSEEKYEPSKNSLFWVAKNLKPIPPKHTRTEYEKVTKSIFDLRDEFERGELYCKHGHAREYTQITNTQTLAQALHGGFCYRKVEKEIDWRDEVHSKLQSDYHWSTPIAEVINDESDCFLELCRVALRANGEIE